MGDIDLSTVDQARIDYDQAVGELERVKGASTVDAPAVREAERAVRLAKRRLMFMRVGETVRSEHLEGTGAPPGSHEHKPPRS